MGGPARRSKVKGDVNEALNDDVGRFDRIQRLA
jgi:hypothetical protein